MLYTADSVDGAFAETFGHGVVGRPLERFKLVAEAELRARRVYAVSPTEDLCLASLAGNGLARLNLDANIFAMADYTCPQAWSRWIHDHPAGFHGIVLTFRDELMSR